MGYNVWCSMEERPEKLEPLLRRMAELNAEADLLSQEIDAHLSRRADTTWAPSDEADESATG